MKNCHERIYLCSIGKIYRSKCKDVSFLVFPKKIVGKPDPGVFSMSKRKILVDRFRRRKVLGGRSGSHLIVSFASNATIAILVVTQHPPLSNATGYINGIYGSRNGTLEIFMSPINIESIT